MDKIIRIGTRESELAVWQAKEVQRLLHEQGHETELVYIKSAGDIDLDTPLYELGVQGIFTKTLDIALLRNMIDIAVHSMKDVPTVPAKGIVQAAVLPRASYLDLFVPKGNSDFLSDRQSSAVIATSSVRRKAQWLHRYPHHTIENLRGNVNTRLRKVQENDWQGAIFAAAGLDRIDLRPAQAVELDWMLPAPAQGAIMVVCRESEENILEACRTFNDEDTALCTGLERDFLRTLFGGCTTPISALATIADGMVRFRGNILSTDGRQKLATEKYIPLQQAAGVGAAAARELLEQGGAGIVEQVRNERNAS